MEKKITSTIFPCYTLKNFDNSYSEITNWIHKEEGWKKFFEQKVYLKPVL